MLAELRVQNSVGALCFVGLSASTRACRAEGSSLESDVDLVSAEISFMIKRTKAARCHSNGLLTLMDKYLYFGHLKTYCHKSTSGKGNVNPMLS